MSDAGRDRGSLMPMTAIFVAFLMIGSWALVSASQQWGARREAHAVAAAAARAGAQGDLASIRAGGIVDPVAATARAESVINAAGHTGTVSVDGTQVTVEVQVHVDYAFPTPGSPTTVTGSATAIATAGVSGLEGG